jgi:hypothetical protein
VTDAAVPRIRKQVAATVQNTAAGLSRRNRAAAGRRMVAQGLVLLEFPRWSRRRNGTARANTPLTLRQRARRKLVLVEGA